MSISVWHGFAVALALIPAAAQAESEATAPPVAISYNLGLVSDYQFRGISLSNHEPVVQGGIDLAFDSGLFLGSWASGIANYGGSNVEVDIYGGYGGTAAGLDFTVGVYGYVYPDGRDVDYVELQSTIAKSIGPITPKLTLAYTPDQWNTARDNFYAALGADIAIGKGPLVASFGVGRENGGYDEKWDWNAGLRYSFDILELSAFYVDSNYGGALEAGRNGRAGFWVGVTATF